MGSLRNEPSPYSPGSFHTTRAFLWISTLIVTSIMIYFAVNLHSGGYKFPYAFLLILITGFLTLLNLFFTTILYCRNSLRPIFSLIMNLILFMLWALSLGFLGYGMRGTLHTTCNTSSWGTSTGVMVCRVYKVLFSFIVVALAFTFFHAAIDVVARRDGEHLLTQYDSMHYQDDYKMHARGESASPLSLGAVATEPTVPAVEDEIRAAGDTRTDAYNTLGTVRQENTAYNMSSSPEHYHPYQQQYQQHEEPEFYDGVPDVPPVSSVRWASAAGQPSSYSPLQTRFDDQQQTGYESYRPHRTPHDEGGYGYR